MDRELGEVKRPRHRVRLGEGRPGHRRQPRRLGAARRHRPGSRAGRRRCDGLYVEGDATDDDVLRAAGIDRARALVAALNTDADNLYVTLSARRLRPDLFIVARARMEAAEAKLTQAGADRVVNPQSIGGARMAALVGQPHVADFLDVVMHDGEPRVPPRGGRRRRRLAGGRPVAARRPPPRHHRGAGAGDARPPAASSGPTRRRTRSCEPARCSSPSAPRSSSRRLAELVGPAALTPRAGCRTLPVPTSV